MNQSTRNRPTTLPGVSWLDKPMPAAVEAERSLLGGLLQEPAWLSRVSLDLRPEDFHRPEHAALYRLLLGMVGAQQGIDLVTVAAEISRGGPHAVDRYGGAAYVTSLPEYCPSTANLGHYVELIVERAQLREIIKVGSATVESAFDEAESRAVVQQGLDGLSKLRERGRRERHAVSVAELRRDQAEHHFDQRAGATLPPLSTGFAQLDGLLNGGLHPGQHVVIAGLTGMGKTALAVSLAVRWAGMGRQVLYHSGEMPKRFDLLCRVQSTATGIPIGNLVSGDLSDEDEAELDRVCGSLDRFVLHDRPNTGVRHIAAEARRLWVGGLAAVVVDYLGLVDHEQRRGDTTAQAVGRTTKALKQLAIELKCPVLTLCQFNRKAAKKDPPKKQDRSKWWTCIPMPSMHDLRDSGEIAEDADTIIFPVSAVGAKADPAFSRQAVIVVEKNRMGATGIARCSWEAQTASYVEGP